MTSDLLFAIGPDLLVLGLVAVLMIAEIVRLDAAWGRLTFAAGLIVALAVLALQWQQGYAATVIEGELRVDRLALLGKAVLLLCGLGVAAGFGGTPRDHKFWILAASSLLGGLVMVASTGFGTLFLGLELLSMPVFALVVQGHGRSAAAEGAFKYLVLSSVASATLLFGASLAYGLTGSLAIEPFLRVVHAGGGAQAQAALLLVYSGLFLKAAVFPFHAWAPDAYSAARLPVTALMASVVKAAVVLAIVRIAGPYPVVPAAATVVTALALVSIVFGNLAALGQLRFRRLLAYSSVAHAGYMIFALLDTTGARASDLLWYTAIYGLATVLACASFAVLCPGDDDRLERLDGAFARHPWAVAALALSMLSLAGVPPLPGFFTKLLVFRSVIASGHTLWATLAFVGSFLGLAYYLGVALRPFRPAVAAPAVSERRTQRDGTTA